MKEWYRFGLGFWTGAFIYSLINLLINNKLGNTLVSYYNYEIMGVAVLGFILNLVLMNKRKR